MTASVVVRLPLIEAKQCSKVRPSPDNVTKGSLKLESCCMVKIQSLMPTTARGGKKALKADLLCTFSQCWPRWNVNVHAKSQVAHRTDIANVLSYQALKSSPAELAGNAGLARTSQVV